METAIPSKTISCKDAFDIANRYKFKSSVYVRIHNAKAKKQQRRNRIFGILVLIFTTTVGTTLFATLNKTEDDSVKYFALVVSAVAAILSALQSFLGFADAAAKHKKSAADFGIVYIQLVNFLLKYNANANSVEVDESVRIKLVADLISDMELYQKAISDAPLVIDWDYNYYKKKEIESKESNVVDASPTTPILAVS